MLYATFKTQEDLCLEEYYAQRRSTAVEKD